MALFVIRIKRGAHHFKHVSAMANLCGLGRGGAWPERLGVHRLFWINVLFFGTFMLIKKEFIVKSLVSNK